MSRSRVLAERRRALVARSDADRRALIAAVEEVERRTVLLDVVVGAARRVHRHRLLAGAAAMGLFLVPLVARTWLNRVLWVAPLVLEGYRFFRVRGAAGTR